MKRFVAKGSALMLLVVCLVFAGQAPMHAQDKQQNGKPIGQGTAPPAKGQQLPPGVTKDELAAYKNIYDARAADDAKIIQLGEDFISKYPMSMYAVGVYTQLTSAYLHTGQEDKMFDAGNKVLAINPDSVDVLAVLAFAIPRRVNAKTPDGPAQLQKAQMYAHHAIELINALTAPTGMDDKTFTAAKNEKLSMCYSGIGTANVMLQKYDDAAVALEQAEKLTPAPDPVDLYLLGLSDEQTNHFTDAIAAYTKCSADQGAMQARCKVGIDETKKKAQSGIEAPPR